MIATRAQGQRGQIMYVLIGIALKSLLIAGLTLGLLALMRQPLGGRAVLGRAYRPARAGHHGAGAAGPAELDRRGSGPARPGRRHRRSCRRPPAPAASAPARFGQAGRRRRVSRGSRSAGVDQPGRRDDGALCRSGGDPAADHLARAGPAGRPARARRRAGRRPLAERPRPRPAADGLQARHRAAHQRRARLADQLGPDAPGDPAQHAARSKRRAKPKRSSPTSSRTSRGWIGSSCCWPASRPPCSGSTRWSGCWPAKRTSCARKRPTMRCSRADIVDTDYAQLLVGVARHECPGLLLGAHGVAPSKGSLARRVARVLDGASVRGPAARSFAAGVFVGAVAIAAPLAALTLTPKGTAENAKLAAAAAAKSGAAHRRPRLIIPAATFRPTCRASSATALRPRSRAPLRRSIPT